jgi:hypothetical protein
VHIAIVQPGQAHQNPTGPFTNARPNPTASSNNAVLQAVAQQRATNTLNKGNADLGMASLLQVKANELQAKAKVAAAKGDKALAAWELGTAASEKQKAAQYRKEGQLLVLSGTAQQKAIVGK